MRIAIVVHGRFDAFDLARELIKRGEDVTLFTNYPKFIASRFGVPSKNVRAFRLHGLISRASRYLYDNMKLPYPEALLNRIFGRWAAGNIAKESWDVVHTWSGVSEEVLLALEGSGTNRILLRASSHIRTQSRLLKEEGLRVGREIETPSAWAIRREEREYQLSDYIRVLSRFAYSSFVVEGVPEEKLLLIPSGVPAENFSPTHQIIEERIGRILSGKPIRALYVGALSFRKGLQDLKTIVGGPDSGKFQFRLVGPIPREFDRKNLRPGKNVEYITKQPQHKLALQYAWADIFIFPTIEDGYPAVIAQAQAAGLPVLATANCQGPDVIIDGLTGWVLQIRRPEAFVEKLQWCDLNRKELAGMVRHISENYRPRDWPAAAENFIESCASLAGKK